MRLLTSILSFLSCTVIVACTSPNLPVPNHTWQGTISSDFYVPTPSVKPLKNFKVGIIDGPNEYVGLYGGQSGIDVNISKLSGALAKEAESHFANVKVIHKNGINSEKFDFLFGHKLRFEARYLLKDQIFYKANLDVQLFDGNNQKLITVYSKELSQTRKFNGSNEEFADLVEIVISKLLNDVGNQIATDNAF